MGLGLRTFLSKLVWKLTGGRRQSQENLVWKAVFSLSQTTAPGPDVLLLGDSVTIRVANQDKDRRTLGEIFGDYLGEGSYLWLAETSFNAGVYRLLVAALAKLPAPARPKVVVLPVNLRSFSPQWYLNPRWSYAADIKQVARRLSMRNECSEPNLNPEEFLARQVTFQLSDFTTIGEFNSIIKQYPQGNEGHEKRKREIFVFHYTHALEADHCQLKQFAAALRTLDELGISTLIYVTPINFRAGIRFVGEEFVSIVDQNIQEIQTTLQPILQRPSRMYDWAKALDSSYFFNEEDATEHLAEGGRHTLARLLGQAATELLRERKQAVVSRQVV